MESTIVAALVASCSSLCLAVIQHFSQRRRSRDIEILKADLAKQGTTYTEYMKAWLKLQVDGEAQEIQAFREILQSAQLVKDKVRLILDHPNSFPDRNLIRSELMQLRTQVLETFARNQVSFSEDHWKLAHGLKNTCSDTLTTITQSDSVTEVTIANLLNRLSSQQQDMRREAYSAVAFMSDQLSRAGAG